MSRFIPKRNSGYSNLLPKTGQTTSYNPSGGDDGDNEAGQTQPVTRFEAVTINGKELIKDYHTGLMWYKKAYYNAEYMLDECVTDVDNSALAGFYDWRVPNVLELLSIWDFETQSIRAEFDLSACIDLMLLVTSTYDSVYGDYITWDVWTQTLVTIGYGTMGHTMMCRNF